MAILSCPVQCRHSILYHTRRAGRTSQGKMSNVTGNRGRRGRGRWPGRDMPCHIKVIDGPTAIPIYTTNMRVFNRGHTSNASDESYSNLGGNAAKSQKFRGMLPQPLTDTFQECLSPPLWRHLPSFTLMNTSHAPHPQLSCPRPYPAADGRSLTDHIQPLREEGSGQPAGGRGYGSV